MMCQFNCIQLFGCVPALKYALDVLIAGLRWTFTRCCHMEEKRLYVVRHGERVNMKNAGGSKWYENAEFQFEPLSFTSRPKPLRPIDMDWNVPLTARGKNQADEAGRILKERIGKQENVQLFSSPAWRCQQTADAIARRLGTKFKVVQGLYEFLQQGRSSPSFEFHALQICL